MTPTTTISILKSLVIDLDQLSILNLTVPSLKKEVLLMVDKFLKVDCPESPAQQIVQLNPEGEIRWCSRWVGTPPCQGQCMAKKAEPPLEEAAS